MSLQQEKIERSKLLLNLIQFVPNAYLYTKEILISSPNFEEHTKDLKNFIEMCKNVNIKINSSESKFAIDLETVFLDSTSKSGQKTIDFSERFFLTVNVLRNKMICSLSQKSNPCKIALFEKVLTKSMVKVPSKRGSLRIIQSAWKKFRNYFLNPHCKITILTNLPPVRNSNKLLKRWIRRSNKSTSFDVNIQASKGIQKTSNCSVSVKSNDPKKKVVKFYQANTFVYYQQEDPIDAIRDIRQSCNHKSILRNSLEQLAKPTVKIK